MFFAEEFRQFILADNLQAALFDVLDERVLGRFANDDVIDFAIDVGGNHTAVILDVMRQQFGRAVAGFSGDEEDAAAGLDQLAAQQFLFAHAAVEDRKSTRLNSS